MPKTIPEIARRYKWLLEAAILPAIILLVGLTAFGLGRISAVGEEGPRLIIRMPDGTTQTASALATAQAAHPVQEAAPAASGAYVGSKSGTKYYLPACSGVSRIKDENKVWFQSVAEAQAAGYTAASNCPGL